MVQILCDRKANIEAKDNVSNPLHLRPLLCHTNAVHTYRRTYKHMRVRTNCDAESFHFPDRSIGGQGSLRTKVFMYACMITICMHTILYIFVFIMYLCTMRKSSVWVISMRRCIACILYRTTAAVHVSFQCAVISLGFSFTLYLSVSVPYRKGGPPWSSPPTGANGRWCRSSAIERPTSKRRLMWSDPSTTTPMPFTYVICRHTKNRRHAFTVSVCCVLCVCLSLIG